MENKRKGAKARGVKGKKSPERQPRGLELVVTSGGEVPAVRGLARHVALELALGTTTSPDVFTLSVQYALQSSPQFAPCCILAS
jgi:hypothetical protein